MDFGEYIEKRRTELIRAVEELVRIPSVEGSPEEDGPFGKEIKLALEKALDLAKSMGFQVKNLDGYVGYGEYIASKNEAFGDAENEEYVGVLGHLDVVPEGDGWSVPPFGAVLQEGKLYGRGALDDKGPVMAALFAMKALSDAGVPLKRKIRILFGTNEENGSGEIAHYLEREKPPTYGFTPDADFPIIHGEKGVLVFRLEKKDVFKEKGNLKTGLEKGRITYIKGGIRPNIVPDFCEARISGITVDELKMAADKDPELKREAGQPATIHVEAEGDHVRILSVGVSAHGSTPEKGTNAIFQMLSFLKKIGLSKTDEMDLLMGLSEKMGGDVFGTEMGIACQDEVSGKLTVNLGTIEGDKRGISCMGDIRYPVTADGELILKKLEEMAKELGAEVKILAHMKALYFPKEHPLIKALQKAYGENTGHPAELLTIGGGTYAKAMPNIVAFGPTFPGKEDLCHKADEYIEVEDLITCAKIYASALYELANI